MKRLLLIPALFLILQAACQTKPFVDKKQKLTLVTYNIGNFAKYTEDSMPVVASALTALNADLVGLNELDSCNTRHNVYQLKLLAGKLGGWDYSFARAFPYAGGAYGNGVASRKRILHSWTIALPKGEGAEPRSVAVVETDECIFASVHLDHRSPVAQLQQVETLNTWFKERFSGSQKPVFLCGDMNALPDSETIAALREQWTQLSSESFSFSSKKPSKCIDYIFAYKEAKQVEVLDTAPVRETPVDVTNASDHLPVYAVVEF